MDEQMEENGTVFHLATDKTIESGKLIIMNGMHRGG